MAFKKVIASLLFLASINLNITCMSNDISTTTQNLPKTKLNLSLKKSPETKYPFILTLSSGAIAAIITGTSLWFFKIRKDKTTKEELSIRIIDLEKQIKSLQSLQTEQAKLEKDLQENKEQKNKLENEVTKLKQKVLNVYQVFLKKEGKIALNQIASDNTYLTTFTILTELAADKQSDWKEVLNEILQKQKEETQNTELSKQNQMPNDHADSTTSESITQKIGNFFKSKKSAQPAPQTVTTEPKKN